MSMYWPVALVVMSNVFYQICCKSTPAKIDPLASLCVTYLVGAAVSALAYTVLNRGGNLPQEFTHLNWAPFVLGIAVVGLECGYIYMYKVGWSVNSAYMMNSSILAVVLLFVGFLVYKEAITLTKVLGIAICMVGLYFLKK